MTGQGVVSCGGGAASSLLVGWVCWVFPGWVGWSWCAVLGL